MPAVHWSFETSQELSPIAAADLGRRLRGQTFAAWAYRPTGHRWEAWDLARYYPGAWDVHVGGDDLRCASLTLVEVTFRTGVSYRRPAEDPPRRLAIATGRLDAFDAAGFERERAVGVRYDGATGSDAFWTVGEKVPRRVVGAARAWFCGNGWLFVAEPVLAEGT